MKSYVLTALLASVQSVGLENEACNLVTTPANGGCTDDFRCVTTAAISVSDKCQKPEVCGTTVDTKEVECYEFPKEQVENAACNLTVYPKNGGCSDDFRCAISGPVSKQCLKPEDCMVQGAPVPQVCYEMPVTPYVPCSNDNTKKNEIILTAMTNHHNDALAKRTADILQYEKDILDNMETIKTKETELADLTKKGQEAAKAANTVVMPAAESQAIVAKQTELDTATKALTDFKVGKEAWQTVLDEIAQSQIALDHATNNAAYATHRCITPEQKAHYDKKIAAEKEIWGYDKLSDAYKKVFDDYITKFTAYHQEQDAVIKEKTGYYKMTDAEKKVYDKLSVQMKEKEDYYDEKFDESVKKEMGTTKFMAMTKEEQQKYLNSKRDADFKKMQDLIAGGNIEMISRHAMGFFGIPEDKKELVEHVIKEWDVTKQEAEDGVRDGLKEYLATKAKDFVNMSEQEKISFIKKVESMGNDRMEDFVKGMLTDEQRRVKDGYFGMNDGDRKDYDEVRDKYRQYFGSKDFSGKDFDDDHLDRRGRGGDSDDSDDDRRGPGGRDGRGDDSDDKDGIFGKIQSMLKGNGAFDTTILKGLQEMSGNDMDMVKKFFNGNDDDDKNSWAKKEQEWESKQKGGEWSECGGRGGPGGKGGPGGRGGRGDDSNDDCERGMCCARVDGKPGNYCVSYWNKDVDFKCLEQAQKLVASAVALGAAYFLI